MIEIQKLQDEVRISFMRSKPNGKIGAESIIVKLPNQWRNSFIDPPALCNIRPGDMPEFIEALELAAKIANGDLVVD